MDRCLKSKIKEMLSIVPAVALLGPRQVGKTTLAKAILAELEPTPAYLDLERPSDISKLEIIEQYFMAHEDRLIIIDEIQHYPNLFKTLRAVIDDGEQRGRKTGRFLLLGSASMELMRQSSESLAGRILHTELSPISLLEIESDEALKLWSRGGLPRSFLANDDSYSKTWRDGFVTSYIERDMLQFSEQYLPSATLRRLWTMLAHYQAGKLNISKIANSLGERPRLVGRCIDVMVDLLLIRKLRPWYGKSKQADKKRLVKTPKIYLRDSGVCHALLGITDLEELLGHPIAGNSWESFAIENILSSITTPHYEASFYGTNGGAEIDLLISKGGSRPWAIEIKLGSAPHLSPGFYTACEVIQPETRFVVYSGQDRFPYGRVGVEAISLREMCQEVAKNF